MIFNKYLSRQFSVNVLCATAVLTGIVWLTQSLRFTNLLVQYGVGFLPLLQMTAFLLPNVLCMALPIGIFMGLIVLLHRLQYDHELVVMRSLGISTWQITQPLAFVSLVATIILYFLSLYCVPAAFQQFRILQTTYQHHYKASMIQDGEFLHFDKITVYAAEKDPVGSLKGVFIYDGRRPEKPVVFMAEEGYVFDEKDNPNLILLKGTRQAEEGKDGAMSLLAFDTYQHALKAPEYLVQKRLKKPSEYSVRELIRASSEDASYLRILRAEAHQRLLIPLFPILFTFVSLFLFFKMPGSRVHRMLPFTGATCCVVLLHILFFALLQVAQKWSPIIWVLYGVIVGGIVASFGGLLSLDWKKGARACPPC